jgi:hypothetical protein
MAKLRFLILLLAAGLPFACGKTEETCICTCTCGSGDKSTLEGTNSEAECASACQTNCGTDSWNASYDCRTEDATAETATDH